MGGGAYTKCIATGDPKPGVLGAWDGEASKVGKGSGRAGGVQAVSFSRLGGGGWNGMGWE